MTVATSTPNATLDDFSFLLIFTILYSMLLRLSGLESPVGLGSQLQVVAVGTLLLIGISSLGFWLYLTLFSDSSKEVPPMKKIIDSIVIVTKPIISVSVNIGANLLASACLGSQVHLANSII
ncbi:MAG: hypothetical protein ACOCXT_06695 [Candidatus Dojkabacteria bacterium]